MCGIAGVTGRYARADIVRRMIEAMHSRGPDDAGCWTDPGSTVALGNCRLAIIDLSEAGHMPMQDVTGRCWITYNGELYNFRVLRRELEAAGHVFRSSTDTEVVLTAYLQWGTACLDRLTGMFAFAIHDSRDLDDPKLFMARDRLGIKPLYWARAEGGVLFASEIKGILASGLVEPVADMQATWDYLSLGSVPGPRTILKGVRSLEPAHALLARGTDVCRWRYWQPGPPAATEGIPTSMDEAATSLRSLLEYVVREHLVADVPVGVFLSGGIDSAGILALAAEATSHPVRAFTVAFGTGPDATDEVRHAADVAARFGADHAEVLVSGSDVVREFDAIMGAMDQPSVDGVNSYFVSRAAHESVTVALSGLGADEVLAGYPHFRWLRQAARRSSGRNPALRAAAAAAERWAPRRVARHVRIAASRTPERHAMLREVFSPAEKGRLFRRSAFPPGLDRPERVFAPLVVEDADPVTTASVVEVGSYLPNTLLRDVDAMSMAHSLEVRVPFVDHRVVELAVALPGDLKLRDGLGKAVLRRALADLLSAGSLTRPKSYFSMPLEEWAAGPLLPRVRDSLRCPTAGRLFEAAALAQVEREARGGRGNRAWAAAVLAAWMERHGVSV